MGQMLCHHVNIENDSAEFSVVNLNNIIKCPHNSIALNVNESKDLHYQSFVKKYTSTKYKKSALDSQDSYCVNSSYQLSNATDDLELEDSLEFACEDTESKNKSNAVFVPDTNALDQYFTVKQHRI
ncbi:Hypothetical_protein [Hexamita inflata]|uniref:Hypothetical_protein n=1 Tax=Hexamita inflata TaxID=28002 RepID=A0AA86UM98_9EUKA|nr:Hypothetical protein HINF_LOCUS44536 [Hexamita inflata]